jgi:hypothetical protein
MLERYNEVALDYYLRGEGGESMRREAEQELYRRGQQSFRMTEEEMVEHLTSLGYIIISPSGEEMYMPD